jgi:lysophospholipase L1-like esterase
MATVSGTFTAVGVSSTLNLNAGDEVTLAISGTYAAIVQLERALSPAESAWVPVSIAYRTANATIGLTYTAKQNDRLRVRCTAYTSGTVAYALTGPSDVALYPARKYVVFLGDSLTGRAFENTTLSKTFYNRSYASWVKFLTKGSVSIDLNSNFGADSLTLTQIAALVPGAIAAKPDIACVLAGTNTPTLGMRDIMLNQILRPLLGAGITVIVIPVIPRAVATQVTNGKQIVSGYNSWLRSICHGQSLPIDNSPDRPGLYLADPTPYLADTANANGEGLTARYLSDGIHTNAHGAYWLAKPVVDILNVIVPPSPLHTSHTGDYFDATYNPNGNLLHSTTTNYGTLLGTTGTPTASTGITHAGGEIADGFHVERLAGTSTVTITSTKESPRTDGPASGHRQKIVVAGSNTGLALEQYQFRRIASPAVGAVGAADIQVGDVVWGGIGLELVSHTGLLGISLELESDPTAGAFVARDMQRHSTETIVMPQTVSGQLRTPQVTVLPGATVMRFRVRFEFDASAVASAATFYLSDAWMRKVS